MDGWEESLGMLNALSDMMVEIKSPSNNNDKYEKFLVENEHNRSSLMYNLCVIKIGIEILKLKFNEMDDLTNSQFSKINDSISEMSDEIFDIIDRQKSMVN